MIYCTAGIESGSFHKNTLRRTSQWIEGCETGVEELKFFNIQRNMARKRIKMIFSSGRGTVITILKYFYVWVGQRFQQSNIVWKKWRYITVFLVDSFIFLCHKNDWKLLLYAHHDISIFVVKTNGSNETIFVLFFLNTIAN